MLTRPEAGNGLGASSDIARAEVEKIEAALRLLPESPDTYAAWKRLIFRHGVVGVKVHDARLVAAMNVHDVRRLLTFDVADFARYEIEVLEPATVLA